MFNEHDSGYQVCNLDKGTAMFASRSCAGMCAALFFVCTFGCGVGDVGDAAGEVQARIEEVDKQVLFRDMQIGGLGYALRDKNVSADGTFLVAQIDHLAWMMARNRRIAFYVDLKIGGVYVVEKRIDSLVQQMAGNDGQWDASTEGMELAISIANAIEDGTVHEWRVSLEAEYDGHITGKSNER